MESARALSSDSPQAPSRQSTYLVTPASFAFYVAGRALLSPTGPFPFARGPSNLQKLRSANESARGTPRAEQLRADLVSLFALSKSAILLWKKLLLLLADSSSGGLASSPFSLSLRAIPAGGKQEHVTIIKLVICRLCDKYHV